VSSTPGDRLRDALRLRRTSRTLTLACVLAVVGGGLVAGVATASGAGGSHVVRVDIGYACRFSSATYKVSALLAAAFPSSAVSGTPIQPAAVQVAIVLPRRAAIDFRTLGASSVSASGSLAVTVTSGSTPVPATWTIRTSAAAAIPASGSLTLDVSGVALPAAASAPGRVSFAATGLALTFTPHTKRGGATSPALIEASCAASGGSQHLATVDVTTASPSANAARTPSPKQTASPARGKRSRIPQGCGHIKLISGGTAVCGFITGYSDVKKLYGAARLGPALANIDFAYKAKLEHGDLVEYSQAILDDDGKPEFPPFRSTFLGFGFVPVTATLTLLERGPINIVSVSGVIAPPYPILVTATTKVSIHVSDVTVNGVPLAVGAACRASYPATLTLVGRGQNTLPPTGYTVPTGGPLAGTLTIPPFVHCGVTENLDPLLTGSISGPGNFAKITQGELCGPVQPQNWTCPPPVPKPIR
jgi:hypothetical protein